MTPELPDRNSPEDWPEAMLVTGPELRNIVLTALAASPEPRWTAADLARMEKNAEELGKRFATPEPQEGRDLDRYRQALLDIANMEAPEVDVDLLLPKRMALAALAHGIGSQDATK